MFMNLDRPALSYKEIKLLAVNGFTENITLGTYQGYYTFDARQETVAI